MGGFNDPETNKKAQEKSLATRRAKKNTQLMKLFDDDIPPTPVDQLSAESFKELLPGFQPSLAQLKILAVALSLEHGDSIRGWFKAAELNRNDWYIWIRNPDFTTWWNKSFNKGIEQYRGEWVAIGLRRMNSNDPDRFNYWKAVGEKIFGFITELKVKQDKSPEEEQLTKELLELVKDVNMERNMKQVDGEVIDIVIPKEIENNGVS